MKLIVDVGVGNAVERLLRESGHDVLSVRDMDPSMPDAEILSVAVAESRLLITMDKDYGELVYHRVRANTLASCSYDSIARPAVKRPPWFETSSNNTGKHCRAGSRSTKEAFSECARKALPSKTMLRTTRRVAADRGVTGEPASDPVAAAAPQVVLFENTLAASSGTSIGTKNA